MPKVIQGRIVYALDPILDPQGNNPKANRPFVVISTLEEIESGADLRLVGISHNVYGEDVEVELPCGDNCWTHIRHKSAAICSWVVRVPQNRVNVGKGIVPPFHLRTIIQKARV